MNVRTARPSDLPAISDIYSCEVEAGTSTFDTEPRCGDRAREWFEPPGLEVYPIHEAGEKSGRLLDVELLEMTLG